MSNTEIVGGPYLFSIFVLIFACVSALQERMIWIEYLLKSAFSRNFCTIFDASISIIRYPMIYFGALEIELKGTHLREKWNLPALWFPWKKKQNWRTNDAIKRIATRLSGKNSHQIGKWVFNTHLAKTCQLLCFMRSQNIGLIHKYFFPSQFPSLMNFIHIHSYIFQ